MYGIPYPTLSLLESARRRHIHQAGHVAYLELMDVPVSLLEPYRARKVVGAEMVGRD